jgi:transcriptional regulator with XRE-family HTH domain
MKEGESVLSDLGTRIREERLKRGWTQNELGKIIGRSGVAVMRYEKDSSDKDHREPSLEIIEAIAKAFEMSPFQLMGAEYFDAKYPEVAKEVKEYEVFIEYLRSIGYSVKEIPEISLISPEEATEEIKKEYECNSEGFYEGESYTITISKGQEVKLTFSEGEFGEFQNEIAKAVEFALYQRKQK